jgi:hypothetical protein
VTAKTPHLASFSRHPCMRSSRWFTFWLSLGFGFAILLVANSLSGYLWFSKKVAAVPVQMKPVFHLAVNRIEAPSVTARTVRRNLLFNAIAAIGVLMAFALAAFQANKLVRDRMGTASCILDRCAPS